MSKLCRDAGFWVCSPPPNISHMLTQKQMVFMIRLSIIPSHMSTAVFSTCDVRFWHFAVSTFFTLPKQLILVYLGVLLVGGKSDFWIKFGLFGVAGAITVASAAWIWWKMAAIKKELIARQDAVRARRALRRDNSYNNSNQAPSYEGARQSGGGGGAVYAPQFEQEREQEQADVYAASSRHHHRRGSADAPPMTPSSQRHHDKAYQPYNAQQATVYVPDHATGGDLGVAMYGQAYSPPGQAFTTPEAYHALSPATMAAAPRYQASVQDSPEQTTAHKPHGFV